MSAIRWPRQIPNDGAVSKVIRERLKRLEWSIENSRTAIASHQKDLDFWSKELDQSLAEQAELQEALNAQGD